MHKLSEHISKSDDNINKQNDIIESQKGRLDEAISRFQTQFSEAEDRRREQYETNSIKRNELFQDFQQQIKTEMN